MLMVVNTKKEASFQVLVQQSSKVSRNKHINWYILKLKTYLLISITTVVTTAARNTKPPKTPNAIIAPRQKKILNSYKNLIHFNYN